MRNRTTYPKEGERKLKETIRELRAEITRLEKENRLLNEEIQNIVKPVRTRKTHQDTRKMTNEEWRKDFLRRVAEARAKAKENDE